MKFKLVSKSVIEVSEAQIEKAICDYAKLKGWKPRKFKTPGDRAAMDRIFFKKGRVCFLEVKREGEKPTAKQHDKMVEYKCMDFDVDWTDSVDGGMAFIDKVDKKFWGKK